MKDELKVINKKYEEKTKKLMIYISVGVMAQCALGLVSTISWGIRDYINPFKNDVKVINYHKANDSLMELLIEREYHSERPMFSYEPNHIQPNIKEAYNTKSKKQESLTQAIRLTGEDITKMEKIKSVEDYHKWEKGTQKFKYLTGICSFGMLPYLPIYGIGKGVLNKQKKREINKLRV